MEGGLAAQAAWRCEAGYRTPEGDSPRRWNKKGPLGPFLMKGIIPLGKPCTHPAAYVAPIRISTASADNVWRGMYIR